MNFKHPFLIAAVLLSAGGAIAGAATFAIVNSYINTSSSSGSSDATPSTNTPMQNTSSDRTDGPLYFTTMTHMEGSFPDDRNQKAFEKHASDIRWAMDLFDEYGVKLTIESEQSFAKANTIWEDNVLADVVAQGHGVGTHADFGAGVRDSYTVEELAAAFKENKALIDDLVGAENNIGVSGGTGPTDWVLGASGAGFKYMDGVTGFGYLSMPERERPTGWTDSYIRTTTYHDAIPVDFSERIYPLELANAQDLEVDDQSVITVMGGDIGELASISEDRKTCNPDCVFTAEDIDAIETYIQDADEIRDRSRFARLNIHIPLIHLNERNEDLLRELLSMLKSYGDNGTLKFATQKASYEAYQSFVSESIQ